MPSKAAISLTTGLEDPEKVTVAFLVAVGAPNRAVPRSYFSPRRPCASPSTVWLPVSPATGVRR